MSLLSGETGIGKSTLMDTLFNTNFENFESSHFEPKVKLRAQTYDLQESNVRLKLTIVNTVGFGDQMNKQERQVSQRCIYVHPLNNNVKSIMWMDIAVYESNIMKTFRNNCV